MRENLNVVEEAHMVYDIVYEQDRGVENTAKLLGKSENWVISRLDILDFPQEIIQALEENQINLAVAKAVAKCTDPEHRKSIMETAIRSGATAATVRNWIGDEDVKRYNEHIQSVTAASNAQKANMGKVYMHCGVCNTQEEISNLKHIWMCAQCLHGLLVAKSTFTINQEEKDAEN